MIHSKTSMEYKTFSKVNNIKKPVVSYSTFVSYLCYRNTHYISHNYKRLVYLSRPLLGLKTLNRQSNKLRAT